MHQIDGERTRRARYHRGMEAFFVSTGIVALAEMGDKTQLLALILAVRFRKPWPIVLGILVATLANHAMAGAVGGLGDYGDGARPVALGTGGLIYSDGGLDVDPGQTRG